MSTIGCCSIRVAYAQSVSLARVPPSAQVLFEGILLKPSMVTPGADSPKREKPEVVADYTLKLLKRRVPPAVPGVHWGNWVLARLPARMAHWRLGCLHAMAGCHSCLLVYRRCSPPMPDKCSSSTQCYTWLEQSDQHSLPLLAYGR